MKKNCHSCKYLSFDYGNDFGDYGGYYCEGRDYKTPRDERNHLDKLNDPGYREKFKRCHETSKLKDSFK